MDPNALYTWLLLFGFVLWAAVLVWYLRQPQASVYHPASYYLLFHGVLFAIRPILAWTQNFDAIYAAMQFHPTIDDKITVLAGADLALVIFVGVSTWVGDLAFVRASSSERGEQPSFNLAFWLTVLVCLPVAILSLAYSWSSQAEGVTSMAYDSVSGRTVNTTTNGYFTDAVLMLGPLAAVTAWAGKFRPWSLVPMVVFVFIKAGTGGRYPFVMATMSTALFYMYETRLRWPPRKLLMFAVPLIMLFTIIGEDRGEGIRQWLSGEQAMTGEHSYFASKPLESMDYGNMEFFEYIVNVVPKKSGTYDYFMDNLQVFTEPVPRVLWHSKPGGAPFERVFMWRYGVAVGATNSVPGEGWRAFGWIGIVIWTALFAWFYGRVYNAFVACRQTRTQVAAFLIFTPGALQCFRDGVLMIILKTSFFPLLPIFVWWGWTRLLRLRTSPTLKFDAA